MSKLDDCVEDEMKPEAKCAFPGCGEPEWNPAHDQKGGPCPDHRQYSDACHAFVTPPPTATLAERLPESQERKYPAPPTQAQEKCRAQAWHNAPDLCVLERGHDGDHSLIPAPVKAQEKRVWAREGYMTVEAAPVRAQGAEERATPYVPATLLASERKRRRDAEALLAAEREKRSKDNDYICEILGHRHDLDQKVEALEAKLADLAQRLAGLHELHDETKAKLAAALKERDEDQDRAVALQVELVTAEQAFDGQMIRANVLSRDNDALRADDEAMKAVVEAAERLAARGWAGIEPDDLVNALAALREGGKK